MNNIATMDYRKVDAAASCERRARQRDDDDTWCDSYPVTVRFKSHSSLSLKPSNDELRHPFHDDSRNDHRHRISLKNSARARIQFIRTVHATIMVARKKLRRRREYKWYQRSAINTDFQSLLSKLPLHVIIEAVEDDVTTTSSSTGGRDCVDHYQQEASKVKVSCRCGPDFSVLYLHAVTLTTFGHCPQRRPASLSFINCKTNKDPNFKAAVGKKINAQ
jgi:hypothetical protein